MVEFEFDYELEDIFAILTDPEFIVERSIALGDLDSECEVIEDGERIVVVSDRKVHRDVPGFLTRIFDPVQLITMTETWRPDDGGWICRQQVDIKGAPLKVFADIELFPTETGCCYRITQGAKASLPLIGGRLEKFAVSQAVEACRDDMRYLADYLEET
jgi:Protein of unknown function (DUF2505)